MMATLYYTNTFFGDNWGDTMTMYQCRSDQFAIVSGPIGRSTSCRTYQSAADTCAEFGGTEYKHRTQLVHGRQGNYGSSYPNGLGFGYQDVGPFWFGFSAYLPSSNPTVGGQQTFYILWDLKSFSTEFGEPTIYCIYGNTLWIEPNKPADPNAPTRFIKTIPFNTWTRFVMYVERRITNGVFRLWINDVLEVDYTGQTLITLPAGTKTYFRTGVYYGDDTKTAAITTYFTDVRIAQGADGYALVDPQQSISPGVVLMRTGYDQMNRRRRRT